MTTGRHSWWSDLWRHIPAALGEFPLLTAGEQTKLSWAKPIKTPEEAPPLYAESLAAFSARRGGLSTCILTPSYAGFLTCTTEKLVCVAGDEIVIFERAGDSLHSTSYALAQIDLVEVGCILLSSWLKLVGTDSGGQHTTTTIKFNSVTDYLFTPILNHWRRAQNGAGAALLAHEQAKFDYLNKEHYKFMNVARRVILPGDSVLASIMQPELRVRRAALLGHRVTRTKAPAHIVVLTDRELIVASEQKQERWRVQNKYGSITTYIPLRNIIDAALDSTGDGCLQLSICLPGNEQIQIDFATAQQADVQSFVDLLPPARLSPRFVTPLS